MAIFDHLQPQEVSDILHACDPGFVCFDGNIPSKVMLSVANTCRSLGVSAFFEPTSVPKSLKLFEDPEIILSGSVRFTSPNQYELEAMTDMAKTVLPTVKDTASALCPKDAPSLAHRVLPQALYLSNYIPNILLKLGEHGCLYVAKWRDAPIIQYFSPEKIAASDIKSVNGAGDTFVGTLAASLYRHPLLEPTNTDMWRSMITRAQKAAVLTLQSELAVSPKISEMAR
ncbi:Ribokinase-like protein [Radiomyces spectabilis]|uniref:Ribokinase-like protein n=1 Tax=Radiomyces spectabilis TaxID=64574 RepID=UPI00221FBED1|nr:Ribokinase-like protein [Radiomyces spectabilis]KAI8391071.1 Ribokinase-like protein [Radiomyces spectabilis]